MVHNNIKKANVNYISSFMEHSCKHAHNSHIGLFGLLQHKII